VGATSVLCVLRCTWQTKPALTTVSHTSSGSILHSYFFSGYASKTEISILLPCRDFADWPDDGALGSVVVRESDLWSKDRGFDSQPVHCRVAWVNSTFHPSGVDKLSTSLLAGVKAGRVHRCLVAGNTVTDPIRQVTPRSSRTNSRRGLYLALPLCDTRS